jgi:hypothetical protein
VGDVVVNKQRKQLPLGADNPLNPYDVISCDVTMKHIRLEVKRFMAEQRFDEGAYLGNLRMESFYDHAAQAMVLRTLQRVASKKLDVKTVRFPSDWWQAVKRRFFPAWALAKWPVQYTEVTMEANAYMPDICIPDHDTFVEIVMATRGGYQ